MNAANFTTFIRTQTSTDSTTLPDPLLRIYANIAKDEIAKEIAKRNEDFFGMPFLTNLVGGQREYSLPDEILNNIKAVEVKLDGTNWTRAKEIDLNSYQWTTDEATIEAKFSQMVPCYDIFRKSLWLYTGAAVASVTNGIKLWAIIYPADLSDLTSVNDLSVDPSTTSHGIPRQFHELWARRVCILFKEGRDRPLALTQREQNYYADLKLALDAISEMNLDRNFTPTRPYNDGSNY